GGVRPRVLGGARERGAHAAAAAEPRADAAARDRPRLGVGHRDRARAHQPPVARARRDRAPAGRLAVDVGQHAGARLGRALALHVAGPVGHRGVAVAHAPAAPAARLLDADDLVEPVVAPDGAHDLDAGGADLLVAGLLVAGLLVHVPTLGLRCDAAPATR